MKIGLRVPSPKPTAPLSASFIARTAEKLGFESIWFPEHPILPVETRSPGLDANMVEATDYAHFPDPFISLAFAAAVTTQIKLGTGISLLAEHNPLVLAKEIATLDRQSGGRFLFGIGAGWNEREASIMGVDFKKRWTQTREAALALKKLWSEDEAAYDGTYYNFPPVWCYPKPAQLPHPPILIGSNGKSAFKNIAEWGDEWLPLGISPQQLEEGRRELSEYARQAGRKPGSIQITMYAVDADRDLVRSYFAAGAHRVVVKRVAQTDTEAEFFDDVKRIAASVL